MGLIASIKDKARMSPKSIKKAIQSEIVTEQIEIEKLQREIEAAWQQDHKSEEGITNADILTIELDRRTKRMNELIIQMQKLDDLKYKRKEGCITADTFFKGMVSIATVVLVLYAEESRPIISKAMSFVVRPRL